jgi:diaminohydroxyphosphoribosylaminopyrimidine deaminase/5-amino-6-(5-phosphoribosylamino)uracil reductase
MRREKFMREALLLAEGGKGMVSPNPLVGAVIVKNNRVVGRGYHEGPGTPHAEVNALNEAGELARGATLYATLEPCSTWGRTPPCTDAIISAGLARVFVSTTDPNPSVSGNGIRLLQAAGIKVEVGLLREEAESLNECYMKFMRTGLPFVILKIALTIDGLIATETGESKWITGTEARTRVQELRREVDAVLIGVGTALTDNPSLTVREPGTGREPKRIVLDSKLRISKGAAILDGSAATVIATTLIPQEPLGKADIWTLDQEDSGRVSLDALLAKAAQQGITSILVEGGAQVFSSFISEGKADKLILFVAAKVMGSGIGAFSSLRTRRLEDAFPLDIRDVRMIGGDMLVTAYPGERRVQ